MTENIEGAVEGVTADLAALKHDLARLAETVAKLLQDQTQTVGSRVYEAVGDAREKLGSTATNAQSRISSAGRTMEAGIEHNAMAAVLIAFGVGISIGVLSRLRG